MESCEPVQATRSRLGGGVQPTANKFQPQRKPFELFKSLLFIWINVGHLPELESSWR